MHVSTLYLSDTPEEDIDSITDGCEQSVLLTADISPAP